MVMLEIYRGIWVVAYREILRFVQERSRMISSFAFPLMFLVVFGAGFNRIIGPMSDGINFVKFMYPGILAMTVVMSSMFSGMSIVWDREFGFLKEILVAPISRTGIVLGKVAGGAFTALVQGMILLLVAPFIGVSITPILVVKYLFLVLPLALSLSGMGIFVATRMRSQQGFQMVMQLLIFPMIFLSGVFFPVDNVPMWMQIISKINPLTYGVDAVRQLFLNGQQASMRLSETSEIQLGVTVFGHRMGILEDVIIMGLLGIVFLSAAIWSFQRQE